MQTLYEPIELRDLEPPDAAAVNAVARAAWQEYADVVQDWRRLAAYVARTASLVAETELIVARLHGRIVGVVGYTAPARPREPIFPDGWAVVRMLSVDPSARGRGVGRALVDECIRRARRDRAPQLGLHTSPVMRTALDLYRRLGFTFVRDLPPRHGVPYAVYALTLATSSRDGG